MNAKTLSVPVLLVFCLILFGRYAGNPLAQGDPQGPQTGQAKVDQEMRDQMIEKHLNQARGEYHEVISEQLGRIDAYFNRGIGNIPKFVDSAFGYYPKWLMAKDTLSYYERNRCESYLRQQFSQLVINQHDLLSLIQSVEEQINMEFSDIENRMLVSLYADLEAAGFKLNPELTSLDLDGKIDSLTGHSLKAAKEDLSGSAGRLAISLLVERILTAIILRGGGTVVTQTTGAALAVPTWGLSIAIGIITDQLLERIWNWYYDPKGRLRDQLQQSIRQMRQDIRFGVSQHPGLEPSIHALVDQQQAEYRRKLPELILMD